MKKTPVRSRQYLVKEEPYYLPVGREAALFESAYGTGFPCSSERFGSEYEEYRGKVPSRFLPLRRRR